MTVLDADDRLEPDFLRASCAILEQFPQVQASSSWLLTYGLGIWPIRPTGGDVTEFLARNNCPATITFRRDRWVACGGYDEGMTEGYEDWDFCLRLLSDGGRIQIIEAPLVRYRTDPSSLNMDGFQKRVSLVGAIVDRHPELFARYARELAVAKEQIAVDRLQESTPATAISAPADVRNPDAKSHPLVCRSH